MTNIDSNDVRKIAKLMNTQRFDILHHYYQLPKYREFRFETSHASPTNNFTYCVKN